MAGKSGSFTRQSYARAVKQKVQFTTYVNIHRLLSLTSSAKTSIPPQPKHLNAKQLNFKENAAKQSTHF